MSLRKQIEDSNTANPQKISSLRLFHGPTMVERKHAEEGDNTGSKQ